MKGPEPEFIPEPSESFPEVFDPEILGDAGANGGGVSRASNERLPAPRTLRLSLRVTF